MIPTTPLANDQTGRATSTDTSTFKAFVFPRPNYVFTRTATVSLDAEQMIVTDSRGVEVFRSTLADLKVGVNGAFLAANTPYVLFWGPEGSMVRLGFSRTTTRTAILLAGLLATLALLGNIGSTNALFNFSVGLCVMVPALWAARLSTRSDEQQAFEDRLLELEPNLADRETMPFLPATTGLGRFGLLAFVGFYVFLGAGLITMLASEVVRPDAPTPDPEGVAFRVSVLALAIVGLGLHTFHHLKPYRPWATAQFGGYSNFVNIVMVPLLLVLVLAIVAVGRQITGV